MSSVSCLESQTSQNDLRMIKMSKIQDTLLLASFKYIERDFKKKRNASCLPGSVDFMAFSVNSSIFMEYLFHVYVRHCARCQHCFGMDPVSIILQMSPNYSLPNTLVFSPASWESRKRWLDYVEWWKQSIN